MDRTTLAVERAEQALTFFQEVLQIREASEIERDAAIQRFGFTFEATWKAARHYLRDVEGIDAASPKGVIRSCREIGLFSIDEATRGLEMVDDRNLTSHTYDRHLALEIYGRLQGHCDLMLGWIQRMKQGGSTR